MAYTAEDFDENGQFIRDPRYMIGENLASQDIAKPRDEEEQTVFHLEVKGKAYQVSARSRDEAIQKAQAHAAGAPSEEELRQQGVYKRWESQIDRTPTEMNYVPPRSVGGPVGAGTVEDIMVKAGNAPPPSQENPNLIVKLQNAADLGVDTTTGLRNGVRLTSGLLAFNQKASAAEVESKLREMYKGKIEIPEGMPLVFEDASTGLPMYLRLTNDGMLKPTLINPPGIDTGDFVELAGEIPTFALEILGGVTGAAGGSLAGGTGTMLGGTTGAAVGGALSIPLRVALAEQFGADPDAIAMIKIGDEAAFQAAVSGGGELFGFALNGAVSGLRNFFGRSLDIDDLPALEDAIKTNLKKVAELQRRTGQRIDLSMGELTGDPDLLIAEANMMNQQVGKSAREMRASEVRSAKASRQALREIATQDVRAPTDGGFRSVEEVSKDVRNELGTKPQVELEGVQLEAQNALTHAEQAAKLDTILDEAYALRDNVFAHAERMHAAEALAWDNYRRTIRWDPDTRQSGVLIDNRGQTPIREVAQRLYEDQKGAVLLSLQNSYRATLENMGFSPSKVDEMVGQDQLVGLAGETLDPFHLHMALSHMKKELRLLEAGDNSRGWEAGDLRDVITAIEDTMKSAPYVTPRGNVVADSTRANVRAAWVDANRTTQELHNLLDTKNMQTLLETRVRIGPDGTTYEMPNLPGGLLQKRLLVPGDARFMMEALQATGYDPVIKMGLMKQLQADYVRKVLPGGRFSQTAHNKWMLDYEDHRRFLGLEADIDNIALFGRQVDEAELALKNLQKELGQMYGRNVADPTKPLNIADELLSNRVDYEQAARIMSNLDKFDSRLANEVREKVLEKLDLDLTSNNNLIMNSGKLTEVLRTNRKTLESLYGKQYVQDLDLLNSVLKMTDERTFRKSTKELLQTPFVSITRSLFGPLSKKQRFLTAVQRVARNSRAGSVTDLLRDPTALRQFVRLKNLKITDPRYWITIQGLNLLEYARNDEESEAAYQEFIKGTLQEEQARRETPRRYGTNL